MAISTEKPKFEVIEEGTYPAVCVAVVDLGTQRVTFGQNAYDQHKVYLAFELAEKDGQGRPFLIASDYALVTSGKSRLRPLIAGLFGKEAAETDKFDVAKFRGMPCLLTVAHHETASGRTVAQINSISRVPKGQKVEPPEHRSFVYEIGQGVEQPLYGLPDWLPYLYGKPVPEVVAQAKEWRDRTEQHAAAEGEAEVGDDPNIPF